MWKSLRCWLLKERQPFILPMTECISQRLSIVQGKSRTVKRLWKKCLKNPASSTDPIIKDGSGPFEEYCRTIERHRFWSVSWTTSWPSLLNHPIMMIASGYSAVMSIQRPSPAGKRSSISPTAWRWKWIVRMTCYIDSSNAARWRWIISADTRDRMVRRTDMK